MANGYIQNLPSLYTPEKKKELQYIQKEFVGITGYSKRLEETWRARPAIERWGLAGLAQVPMPWGARAKMPEALETLRWGYTPEQVRERAMVIGEERAELLRQRKVTTSAKNIINHLLYLASIGTPVKTEEELKVKFPEVDADWEDEDIEWLVKSTLEIAGMSPEEIKQQMATGAFVPTEEVETPVDWEAVAAFYKKQKREDPSLIAATLAFEQDVALIKHGLEDMFKPTGATMTAEEQAAAEREAMKTMFPDDTEEQIEARVEANHNLIRDASESDKFFELATDEGDTIQVRVEDTGMVYDENNEEIGHYDATTGEFTPITTTGEQIASGALRVVSAVGQGIEYFDTPYSIFYSYGIIRMKPEADRSEAEQRFLDLYMAEADPRNNLVGWLKQGLPWIGWISPPSDELLKAYEEAVPEWLQVTTSFLNPAWYAIPGAWTTRLQLKGGELAIKTGLSRGITKQLLKTLGWRGSRGLKPQRAIELAVREGLITAEHGDRLIARQIALEGAKISSRHWLSIAGGRLARIALIPPALAEYTLSLPFKGIGWAWRTASYTIARQQIAKGLEASFIRHLGETEAKVRLEELAKVLQVDIPKLGENASTNDTLKAVAIAIHDAMRHIRSERYAKKYASNYAKELGDVMLIDATGGVAPEVAAKNTWMRISRGTTASTEKFIALMDRVVAGEIAPSEITAEFIEREFPELVGDEDFIGFMRKYLVDSGAKKASEVAPRMKARTTVEIADEAAKLLGKKADEVSLADIIRIHYGEDEAKVLEEVIYKLYTKAKVEKKFTISSFKTAINKILTKPKPIEGVVMPKEAQQRLLGMASKGKPGLSTETMGLVYRDASGKPIAVATLHPEASGAVRLGSMVITGEGLLKGRIAKAFIDELKRTPNLVMPPVEEMSPEAIKIVEKLGLLPEAKAMPEVTDAFTRDTLDFLGIHATEKGMPSEEVLTEGMRRMAVDINQAKVYGSASLEAGEALAEVYLRRDPTLYNSVPKAPDFASVPDGSVGTGTISLGGREVGWGNLLDTDHFVMRLANKTGTPALYRSYMRIYYSKQAATAMQNAFRNTIYKNGKFRAIARDRTALDRVTQYIRHQNPRLAEAGVTFPEGITPAEERLANVLIDLYKSYETKVRYIRFWLAYDKTGGSVKQIMKMIKGTTKADIQEVCNIVEKEGWVAAEEHLSRQTWGTIGSGYDPWLISSKAGIMPEPSITSFPRTGIETRVGVEFEQMDRDILQRTATYIRDIEFDYLVLPEVKRFDSLLGKISPKLTPRAKGYVTSTMTRDIQHMKGIFRGSDAYRIAMRVYSQAMAATFWNPRLAFRNCFQIFAFYPERAKLFKYGFMGLGAQDKIFYTEIVSQLSGVTRDLMFRGQRAFPGLDTITRFANRSSMYPHSDDVFRELCFTGSMNQAREAGATYLASGRTFRDYDKLLADSGLLHIEPGLRRGALQKLTTPETSYMVKGLENVKSLDAFAYDVGKAITDLTHFKYTRALRAPVEQGEAGILLFNLFTFPRSYAQRVAFKIGKLNPKAEVSIAERMVALRDLQNLIIVGSFVGWIFKKVSGSKFNPYSPQNIVSWQPGGLALGAVAEIAQTPLDMFIVATGSLEELWGASTFDSEAKEAATNRLMTKAPRTMRLFVPFWKESLGVLEGMIATQRVPGMKEIPWTEDIDINFVRWARSKIDKDYEPKEVEEIERDLLENCQHMLFRSVPPDPTKVEESQTELDESEAKLGTRDEEGHLWTLRDFGNDVMRIAGTLPYDMIDESYGFSELAMARIKAEEVCQEYNELPDYPSDNKVAYRTDHPEVDAWLFFWGEPGKLHSEEAIINVIVLCRYYGITQEMHGTLIDEPARYREEREEWEMQLYEYNQWQTPEDILNWRNYSP